MMGPSEDAWDVFGDDPDDEDDNDDDSVKDNQESQEGVLVGITIATLLSQAFLKADPHIRLSERSVFVLAANNVHVSEALRQRGMAVSTTTLVGPKGNNNHMVDAIVVLGEECGGSIFSRLVPGGILIYNDASTCNHIPCSDPVVVHQGGDQQDTLFQRLKLPAHLVHTSRCRWLVNHSLETEKAYLQSSSRYLSSHERITRKMSETSIQKAVHALKEFGYCIVRGLLDPHQCQEWGATMLESVHSAAKVLLERDQVDIYRPHTSKFEPQAYRELSMREDLRFDLRDAPALASRRAMEDHGNEAIVIDGKTKSFDGFVRGNENILEIIRRTMNPRMGELFKGNLGRFNFGGSGTNGSFQDLRVSPVGGIVTLPGCGDQAIHADTPHLFESIADLPAHYINVFAPGTAFNPKVGGTAFVHGSHNLEFTAKHCGSREDYMACYPFLVRPALDLGDVILFDCRILHFGTANDSDSGIERVLLYTNTTMAWFSDPKNWDDRRQIFE